MENKSLTCHTTSERRLIDANATLVGIETFMQCYAEKEKELTPFCVKVATQALDMVRQFIKEMPIVDAVEVVRCKDCKHLECGYKCYRVLGAILGDKTYMLVDEDDFCSGERREGE